MILFCAFFVRRYVVLEDRARKDQADDDHQ